MLGAANGSQNDFIPMIIILESPQSFTWSSKCGQLRPKAIPLCHGLENQASETSTRSSCAE